MKDIVYAIPSHKRENIIVERTLKFLKEHKVDYNSIYVFVSNKNYNKYKKKINKDINLIVSIEGVANNREFISNYFQQKQKIVYLDDDIKSVEILNNDKLEPIENLRSEAEYVFGLLEGNKTALCGVYPCRNAFFMKQGFTTDLKFCCGALRFTINDRFCERRKYTRLEDYETSIKYFKKYGKILRLNYMTINCDYGKLQGGMQDNTDRSYGKKLLECERFRWQYADYCKIWRNKKRVEIKFKRKIIQPEVNTLWIGNKLNPLSRLAIKSWIDNGYKVNLYLYEDLDLEPIVSNANVVIRDANEIIELKGTQGTLDILPFSDVWRYKLLYEKGGTWVDADMIILEHIPAGEEIIISSEATLQSGAYKSKRFSCANIGVLRFERGDELLEEVIKRVENKKQRSVRTDNMKVFQRTICDSYIYDQFVLDPLIFCPLHWWNAKEAFYTTEYKTKYSVEQPSNEQMLRNSYCIHLWNSIVIQKHKIDFDNIKDKSLFSLLKELFA